MGKETIQCQKKGCRSQAVWIVISHELFLGKPPDECDILQKPIGFCTATHMGIFFTEEYSEWALNEKRKYKRMKR